MTQLGSVDVGVNNAGIVSGRHFLEVSDASIERTMNVNSMAHMWLAKKFLPPMIERDSGAREKGEHGGSSALVLTRRAQDTG